MSVVTPSLPCSCSQRLIVSVSPVGRHSALAGPSTPVACLHQSGEWSGCHRLLVPARQCEHPRSQSHSGPVTVSSGAGWCKWRRQAQKHLDRQCGCHCTRHYFVSTNSRSRGGLGIKTHIPEAEESQHHVLAKQSTNAKAAKPSNPTAVPAAHHANTSAGFSLRVTR